MIARIRYYVCLCLISILSVFCQNCSASSENILYPTKFGYNNAENVKDTRFFTVFFSEKYFLKEPPDELSSYDNSLQTAFIGRHKTRRSDFLGKSVMDYLYELSCILAIMGAIVIFVIFVAPFILSYKSIKTVLMLKKRLKIALTLIAIWIASVIFFFSHIPIYIDNACSADYVVFVDGVRKGDLKSNCFTSIVVSMGTHKIVVADYKTEKPVESSFIRASVPSIIFKSNTYMVYNIGSCNYYDIEKYLYVHRYRKR